MYHHILDERSGRVLDLRLRGHRFVSLSKTFNPLLSADSTQEMFGHDRKNVNWDVKHTIKQTKYQYVFVEIKGYAVNVLKF